MFSCEEKFYNQNLKHDKEKLRYELIPTSVITALAKVLTYGANKYSANSWQNIEPFEDRYYAALLRHLIAWRDGVEIDEESGLKHIEHVLCNAMFLCLGNNK